MDVTEALAASEQTARVLAGQYEEQKQVSQNLAREVQAQATRLRSLEDEVRRLRNERRLTDFSDIVSLLEGAFIDGNTGHAIEGVDVTADHDGDEAVTITVEGVGYDGLEFVSPLRPYTVKWRVVVKGESQVEARNPDDAAEVWEEENEVYLGQYVEVGIADGTVDDFEVLDAD